MTLIDLAILWCLSSKILQIPLILAQIFSNYVTIYQINGRCWYKQNFRYSRVRLTTIFFFRISSSPLVVLTCKASPIWDKFVIKQCKNSIAYQILLKVHQKYKKIIKYPTSAINVLVGNITQARYKSSLQKNKEKTLNIHH